jgi:hypothetical protein
MAPLLRSQVLAVGAAFLLSAGGPAALAQPRPSQGLRPQTRAERSAFTETSTYADVLAFLDSLRATGQPFHRGSIGHTSEGRAIPFVVLSRPLYDSPNAVRQSGRPVVYVQANIHAGEVEGKEALQALTRDLLADPRPNVLDSLVLIAVPIYNGDGNERFDRQARNRGAQNGPEMVGQRPNAQNLDLNRDYMKADAPETRASLAMFNAWDPHVFVDLHTTNGSFHGYNLTYAPSLNPAAALAGLTFGGGYARDSLLPLVQQRTRARHGIATFPYGNFEGGGVGSVPTAWMTYDHRPRFGTNYIGLRGRIAVLSEAYSHDPFRKRIDATYAFVRELLSAVAEHRQSVLAVVQRSDARLGRDASAPASIPVRASLTKNPTTGDVVYEVLERTPDTTRTEPGLRPGIRRTGRFIAERMPIHDRFDATHERPMPWGYAIDASDTSAISLLALHGVEVARLAAPWTGNPGPQFIPDSTIVAPTAFQGHREVRLDGRWVFTPQTVTLPAGTAIVRTAQRLGVLAMYLLEPESDDGLVAWDIGARSTRGTARSVTRLASGLPLRP